MGIKLYNTLTKKTDELKTLEPKIAKIYTCGLTVYSQPHIGNWVGYIYWDVLIRMLDYSGYKLLRTQNYTDVGHLVSDDDSGEDKMEKGARAEGTTAWKVAQKYIDIADQEAYQQLGLIKPNLLARATDYIDQQIDFVRTLEQKDYTYIIPAEGVYFDTSKFSKYGDFAGLDVNGLEAGARVEIKGKKNITDFALWKFSPLDKKRDMEWPSPWGIGFPGWHLECSVIARESLGDQIDIHTGGIDHIPVHHTNEIAQTESLTGKQFAGYWLHNNHIKVFGNKMSKSLGNIVTLNDITNKGYSLMAFKVMVLSKHYRTEGNFTWQILEAAQNRLSGFYEMADLMWQTIPSLDSRPETTYKKPVEDILCSLQNDLDTVEALTVLNQTADYFKTNLVPEADKANFVNMLQQIDNLLGTDLKNRSDIAQEAKDLISKRARARAGKDYAMSDDIRNQLATNFGLSILDTECGQIWSATKD